MCCEANKQGDVKGGDSNKQRIEDKLGRHYRHNKDLSSSAQQMSRKSARHIIGEQAEVCSYLELLGDGHHCILVLVHDSQEDLP